MPRPDTWNGTAIIDARDMGRPHSICRSNDGWPCRYSWCPYTPQGGYRMAWDYIKYRMRDGLFLRPRQPYTGPWTSELEALR